MEKDKQINTTHIEIREKYGESCLGDSAFTMDSPGERRPRGIVEIYDIDKDGKKQLVRKSNLVVYKGRETLAQMLVRINNPNVSSGEDHFLCWFGLGDGGALPADPFTPIAPFNENDDLESRVMVVSTSATAADHHTAGGGYPKTGYYKIPFDDVTFEADPYNDSRWLVLKIETEVGVEFANTETLSEAGLFTANSSSPGHSGSFLLLARVTFPTLYKDENRRLLFTWYLYV
jgi:hypothetical protein